MSGALYQSWSVGVGVDPNVKFLTTGVILDGTRGSFVTTLPGGRYYLGVQVRNMFGGTSYSEQLVTVQFPALLDDPAAALSVGPDASLAALRTAFYTALEGINSRGNNADQVVDLLVSIAQNLNVFSVTTGATTNYPAGVSASTSWLASSVDLRNQLFDEYAKIVFPPLTGLNTSTAAAVGVRALDTTAVALTTSQVLNQVFIMIPYPLQMDLSLAFKLLNFFSSYLGLSAASAPLPASAFMQLSARDYSSVVQALSNVVQSASYAVTKPSSAPKAAKAAKAAGQRALLAVSDSAPATARAVLDQAYNTYLQALIYVQTNVLTTAARPTRLAVRPAPRPSAAWGSMWVSAASPMDSPAVRLLSLILTP